MKIPVTSTPEKFYKQLVKLMSSFAPIKSLRPREHDLLAEILFQNYKYRSLTENDRSNLIFSKDIRKEIQSRLNISEGTFNVYLNRFRELKVLSKDNKLPVFLSRIIPKDEFEFTVIFKINGET